MKRKIFIVLFVVIIIFACAVPLSSCLMLGGSSGLRYTEIEQDGEVVGYSVKKSIGSDPKTLTIPAEHKGKPVTKIDRYAFQYCRKLESVVLPDTITKIGWDAFAYCNKLKKVYITDLTAWCNISFEGDYATPLCYNAELYVNDELVNDLIIPDGITKISMYSFKRSNISSVTLPSSVERIQYAAFAFCDNLKNVYLNDGLISVDEYAFAFCGSLEEIIFPEGFEYIGGSAFTFCNSLVSVTLPASLETICSDAFMYCCRLARVINFSDLEIKKGSNNFGYIGSYALNVSKGDDETAIFKTYDGYVFYSDKENKYLINYVGTATQLTLPSFSTVGNYAVRSYAFNERDKITDVTIAEGVQSIGGNAFDGCKSLKNIEIPQSVTNIGGYAFLGCENLKSIVIPDGVTKINNNLFVKCSSLESITLPENLNYIGSHAFYETGVSEIIFKGTTEQWNSITKMTKWDDLTGDYTVNCTDGQIQSSH